MINKRLFDWYGIDAEKNLEIKSKCPKPFDTVLIDKTGSCYLCECASWLPQSAGNLYIRSLGDIMNSTMAKELQSSISNGSYRYCNNQQCSWLMGYPGGAKEWTDNVPDVKIKNIRLAIDDSCNLSCPSCRTHRIFERDKFQLRKRYRLSDSIIEYVKSQSHLINIHVGSDGDPFASLVYRYFIKQAKDLPNVRFSIHTNGLLIKKMYHRQGTLFEKLDTLNISIDGGSKETYELLRRGGSWEKIVENLTFIKTIKKFKVHLHMVVQQDNWHEMLLLLELAEKNAADLVYFNRIQDWNTGIDFTKQTFLENSEFVKMIDAVKKKPIARVWTLS